VNALGVGSRLRTLSKNIRTTTVKFM